jgi:hypothetical protein
MKKILVLLVALALPALSLAAYDFTDSGFTVSDSPSSDASSVTLTDESGASLSFKAEAEPTAARVKAMRAIVAEIRGWKSISAGELRIINTNDGLQISVTPKAFTVAGTSLAAAVPGGIQLFYDASTEYDFKVKSGRYVIRLRSLYTTEADMAALALKAFKDPAGFLESQDPIYLFKRIEELDTKLAALDAKEAAFEQQATAKEAELEQKEAAFEQKEGDFEAKVAADAAKAADKSAASWQRTRLALLTALNGDKPINQAALEKLVELKTANPSLTRADAAKQLKALKINMSNQEINAVFIVDFGEFEATK